MKAISLLSLVVGCEGIDHEGRARRVVARWLGCDDRRRGRIGATTSLRLFSPLLFLFFDVAQALLFLPFYGLEAVIRVHGRVLCFFYVGASLVFCAYVGELRLPHGGNLL
jgi:hypothetical protein